MIERKYDIVSLVMNPVYRDARVLKQAKSLQNAGYSILCLGRPTNDRPEPFEVFDGVSIYRPYLSKNYVVVTLGRSVMFVLSFLLLLGHLLGLYEVGQLLAAMSKFASSHQGPIFETLLFIIALFLMVKLRMHRLFFRSTIFTDDEGKKPSKLRGVNPKYYLASLKKKVNHAFDLVPLVIAISRLRPKILHCHDVSSLPIGLLYKAIFGVKLIYDAHEIYEDLANKQIEKEKVYRFLHKKVEKRVSKFITINSSIADWYSTNYPSLPKPLIIKNATAITKKLDYDGRLHHAAGLDINTKIVLYQGGFGKHRGLEWLVRAGKALPNEWALVMMGWGALDEELRELVGNVSEAPPKKVCFIPPASQSDLPYWSQGATLGIIPYDDVGLNHRFCTPNKLWEYPNAGVPLIVSDLPEMRKVVDRFKVGWVLPKDRSDFVLANMISSLTDSDVKRCQKNCEKFISTEGWEVFEKRLVSCYSELLDH